MTINEVGAIAGAALGVALTGWGVATWAILTARRPRRSVLVGWANCRQCGRDVLVRVGDAVPLSCADHQ